MHRMIVMLFGLLVVTDAVMHGTVHAGPARIHLHGVGLKSQSDTNLATSGVTPTSAKRVAVAVTLTKDGDDSTYLDGAAVLSYSARKYITRFPVDLVALVHPRVQKARPVLRAFGFRVIEKQLRFNSSVIEGEYLRSVIDESGCCGMDELIKLSAWELTEYDRVLHLDTDSHITQNIDELFENPEWTGYPFLFTYDRNMDSPISAAPPVQGGFFVVQPSFHTYEQLWRTVRKGDFRDSTGWGGSNVGWCYGGQTVQGLLAYHFKVVAKPEASFEVDR